MSRRDLYAVSLDEEDVASIDTDGLRKRERSAVNEPRARLRAVREEVLICAKREAAQHGLQQRKTNQEV